MNIKMFVAAVAAAVRQSGLEVECIDNYMVVKVEDGDRTHYHSFGPGGILVNGQIIESDSAIWSLQSQTDQHHSNRRGTFDSPDFLWPSRAIDLNSPDSLDDLRIALAERHVYVEFDITPHIGMTI